MKKFWIFLLASLCFSVEARAQVKTITNADLEKYRQARLKIDPDDETQRRRLGLPSRAEEEEARKRRAAETKEIAEKVRRRETESQSYWQRRAFEMRLEIAAVEAEINYVAARIGDIPLAQTYYAIGYNPYFRSSYCCSDYGGVAASGRVSGAVSLGSRGQIFAGVNYNSGLRGRKSEIFSNPSFRHRRTAGGYYGVLAAPFALPTPQNLTREELLARLRALEQTRAGLYARYSVLEDEARRAGVVLE